ncbi:MAG: antibiotic biosynthesis monooxygenase [Streptosporangiales bacterium]|nr:antibiotic biosynthesis monooxygenase [Streptosporangiales bacterium]
MPTSSIDKDASVATLINVFTVAPDKQQQLVDALVRATEDVMQHYRGFVSANIYASLDGQRCGERQALAAGNAVHQEAPRLALPRTGARRIGALLAFLP